MSRIGWRPCALVLLSVSAVVVGAACGGAEYREDPLDTSDPDALFVPVEPPVTTDSPVAGMRGVTHSRTMPLSFHSRLTAVDPTLTEFAGATEAFDAVVTSALAAEKARTDAPTRVAAEIVSVTDGSDLCFSFHECRLVTDAGGEPDYDGVSGGVQLLATGDPARVTMDAIEFLDDGSRRIDDTMSVPLDDPVARPPFVDPRVGFRGDGVLRIGTLLPVAGPDGETARAALAGVRVAVDEINADAGVLGDPVELMADESGDGSPDAIAEAVQRLVDGGADVVIGGTDGSIDRVAIDAVTSAGLVLFSPTDGDRASATIPDLGRFFRLANDEAAEGRALARLIADEGYSRVAVIVGDDEKSVDLNDDLASSLSAASVEIVASIALTPVSEASFVATGVMNASADAVVILGTAQSAAPIIAELTRVGAGPSSLPTFGSSGVMTPDLVRLLES